MDVPMAYKPADELCRSCLYTLSTTSKSTLSYYSSLHMHSYSQSPRCALMNYTLWTLAIYIYTVPTHTMVTTRTASWLLWLPKSCFFLVVQDGACICIQWMYSHCSGQEVNRCKHEMDEYNVWDASMCQCACGPQLWATVVVIQACGSLINECPPVLHRWCSQCCLPCIEIYASI